MRRRLQIARALINRPRLVLLDEPTTGLDPQARHAVWERLRLLRSEGATLVLTTHYMDEAAQLCDRLVIMDQGRIVRAGTPAELVAQEAGREVLELRVGAGRHGRPAWRRRRPVRASGPTRSTATWSCSSATTPRPCTPASAPGASPTRLQSARPAGLEDVFLRLTGRRLRD